MSGAIQSEYEPVLIVIDDVGIHWIVDGNADADTTNPISLAKGDASKAWVAIVDIALSGSQNWGYILASQSLTAAASSWFSLQSGGTITLVANA